MFKERIRKISSQVNIFFCDPLSVFKARIWKELLVAAIGEQFTESVLENDDVCGLSVSPREKDDLIQVWNISSSAAEKSSGVMDKIHSLLPDVRFLAEFYKRKHEQQVILLLSYIVMGER